MNQITRLCLITQPFGSLREIITVQNSLKERLQKDEVVPMETLTVKDEYDNLF